MKKQFNIAKIAVVVVLLLPLLICWFPCEWFDGLAPDSFLKTADGSYYWENSTRTVSTKTQKTSEAVIEVKEEKPVVVEKKTAPVSKKQKPETEKKVTENTTVTTETSVVVEKAVENTNAVVNNVEAAANAVENVVSTEANVPAETVEAVVNTVSETESAAVESVTEAANTVTNAVSDVQSAVETQAPVDAPDTVVKSTRHYYLRDLFESFKELSITLVTTMIFAMILSYLLGYLSVLSMKAGRTFSNIMSAIESVPSILIALFCYAPVSGALAKTAGSTSAWLSLFVFVAAATATVLPEAVRSISIPLSDLYNRKYSVSFRSYGFTKNRILSVLMKTAMMKDTLKRVAAGILLKTLVLDTSFGFVIQVGLGSTGTPQHTSPGALIAANRKVLMAFEGDDPLKFWVPSIILVAISVAFLIILNDNKEEA